MTFVTVGNATDGFRRLLGAVDTLADGGRKVKNNVGAVNQLGHQRPIHHSIDDVGERRMLLAGIEMLGAAGRKVIDDLDFVATLQ